jgi:outer membrane protein W
MRKKVIGWLAAAALVVGCAPSEPARTGVPAMSLRQTASASAAEAAWAVPNAGYTEMWFPVSVGVSYVMALSDSLQDTVGYDISCAWRINNEWDVVLSAAYQRFEWDNGITRSQIFPVMVMTRYSQLMYSGAAWYVGLGVGYSLNDPTDMKNSLAGAVVAGMTQPMDERSLVGLEVGYYTSKAEMKPDMKWLAEEADLSSMQARISFIYNF